MIYEGITLPKVGNLDDPKERKRIVNALYEIDEKLRLVLNNLDLDNLGGELGDQIRAIEQTIESVTGIIQQVQISREEAERIYADLSALIGDINTHVIQIDNWTQEFEKNIGETTDSLFSEVARIDTYATSVGELTDEYRSLVEQLADMINITITHQITLLTEQGEEIQQLIYTNFQWTEDGLYIGKSDSSKKSKYTNDGMEIVDTSGGTETTLASFTSQGAEINNITTQSVAIGGPDFGYFEIVVDGRGFTIKRKDA